MSVYVDDMQAPYRGMIMCHMSADSNEELLAMAANIGVARKWLQNGGTHREHFDICLSKRALAVRFGAEEVTSRELVRRNIAKARGHIVKQEGNMEDLGRMAVDAMDHAMKRIAALEASNAELVKALENMMALVEGECPGLLRDSPYDWQIAVDALARAEASRG